MSKTFPEQILYELETFFQPITDTKGDPEKILWLLSSAGWPLDRIAGINQTLLITTVKSLVTEVEALATWAKDPPKETEAFLLGLGAKVAPMFADVVKLKDCLPTGLPSD